jgi:hypothetical protein
MVWVKYKRPSDIIIPKEKTPVKEFSLDGLCPEDFKVVQTFPT